MISNYQELLKPLFYLKILMVIGYILVYPIYARIQNNLPLELFHIKSYLVILLMFIDIFLLFLIIFKRILKALLGIFLTSVIGFFLDLLGKFNQFNIFILLLNFLLNFLDIIYIFILSYFLKKL